jgi:hypothetical protein
LCDADRLVLQSARAMKQMLLSSKRFLYQL